MLSEEKLDSLLFPYDKVRKIQDRLIKDVDSTIRKKGCILMHAPTGLGKSASTLPIALAHAIENNLTVFFLTSRHTQHRIAIETLRAIKDKHSTDFLVTDLIGKRWMCAQPTASILHNSDFHSYCENLIENKSCEYYNNTYLKGHKLSPNAIITLDKIKNLGPLNTENIITINSNAKLCPYEIAINLSKKSRVIISDYNYIFNPNIQNSLFTKLGITLEKCIIIVDEAHNLPTRVRDSMTEKISSFSLNRAIKEAKKYHYNETALILQKIDELLTILCKSDELLIDREKFIQNISSIDDYDKIITDINFIAEDIKKEEKKSSLTTIANFLEIWKGNERGFARILSKRLIKGRNTLTLSYRCLDPSLITSGIWNSAYSSILMSGTLQPTEMFADILGLPEKHRQEEYPNPFPEDNKLQLIIPETTTKYTARSEDQYKKIAEIVSQIVNSVPGNSFIFFPSYFLRDRVNQYFQSKCKKTTILEHPDLTAEEKNMLINKFKEYKKSGAVLLGVSAGSFGEGIDLPGDLLKAVIVVGLPLGVPDLETKELIRFYDDEFGRGWDYGYTLPAMSKCKQSAGRCIRSETDRGVIVYLDQRFTWPNYFRSFKDETNLLVTKDYEAKIKEFFG